MLTKFDCMIGQIMKNVSNNNNETLVFTAENGKKFTFYHDQDCCENVMIEDIVGDLSDLIESPIVEAEEVSSEDNDVYNDEDNDDDDNDYDCKNWTFYRFSTAKGVVSVRWVGESNGYYSTEVNFQEE